ncbi:MAG: hypothetical protein J3Q66DRAFT_430931 [Benniella sp.]|nr:MAG: hypothetical protein J3Q66DRAFT_430931 [Benniella sp.]
MNTTELLCREKRYELLLSLVTYNSTTTEGSGVLTFYSMDLGCLSTLREQGAEITPTAYLTTLVRTSNQIGIIWLSTESDAVLERKYMMSKEEQHHNPATVYSSDVLPQFRGYLLDVVRMYLSIPNPKDLQDAFLAVLAQLNTALTTVQALLNQEKLHQPHAT